MLLLSFSFSLLAEDNNSSLDEENLLDVFRERKNLLNKSLERFDYNINALEDAQAKNNTTNPNIPLRDPFNLSDGIGNTSTGHLVNPSTFLPNTNQQKIPAIKLKGVINSKSNMPEDLLALLEVDKNDVYMVRVGDEISYDPSKPTFAIKIISISRLSVTVQVGSLGNVLIIR